MTILTAVLASTLIAPTFDDAISNRLEDLGFTGKVQTASRSELRKINADFAMGYEAKETRILWKEPMMIRLDMNINGENAHYIINGFNKSYNIPRLGIKGRDNVAKAPGKHQTLLEFGLITRSMKNSYVKGVYVRTEGSQHVFDVTYHHTDDTARHRVWVDAQKRYITKRMWYSRKGEFLATFLYETPTEHNGVWVPTKVTVKNSENKVAGVSSYTNIRANTGIGESNFRG